MYNSHFIPLLLKLGARGDFVEVSFPIVVINLEGVEQLRDLREGQGVKVDTKATNIHSCNGGMEFSTIRIILSLGWLNDGTEPKMDDL